MKLTLLLRIGAVVLASATTLMAVDLYDAPGRAYREQRDGLNPILEPSLKIEKFRFQSTLPFEFSDFKPARHFEEPWWMHKSIFESFLESLRQAAQSAKPAK